MFSRTITRASRTIRPSATSGFTKPTWVNARFLSESSAPAQSKREVIAEREIPAAEYKDHGAKRTSIPVRDDPEIEVPHENEPKTVKPLTREQYEKLPKALQKLTVMDKVVIITG